MKVYAISDLHLTNSSDKPMDIFGGNWENYFEKIVADWRQKVSDDDIVLIAGDISWAMTIDNAKVDFDVLSELPGRKVIIKGNHDYWWSSYSKVKRMLPDGFFAIQNNAIKIDDFIFCGSRGWITATEKDTPEDIKIYEREQIRLKMSLDDAKRLQTNNEEIIALTHYPPFNVKFEKSPFTDIFDEYGINKVVYGHLHGKDCRSQLILNKNNTIYFLTSCDQINNTLVLISESL